MASVNIVCHECGREFVRTVKQVNSVIRKSGIWTCKPCAITKANKARSLQIGSTRINKQYGYILEKTETGWKRQHVLVVEKIIGRQLVGDEVVHHINGIKTDNKPENLMLMSHGEHTALHNRITPVSKETAKKIGISNQKYPIEKAIAARELVSNGISQRQAALSLGLPQMVVSRIIRNITYMEQ